MQLNRKKVEEVIAKLDVKYSYDLAKKIEIFRTHDTLGFRTAGSQAEIDTGEFLFQEMQKIGLESHKDEITVDGWTFSKARLQYNNGEKVREIELSAYQTQFVTDGLEKYELVNVGRGTADELNKVDVKGKLALVFINQRDEWWINYPTYQAHLRGAVAVIAVQNSGFGQIDDHSLNAQDICGPSFAPAFSMSKRSANELVDLGLTFGKGITVYFEADSRVQKNCNTYNITGIIEGKSPSAILITAHYDSYFSGFQDDNTGATMLLGMARAIIESGYTPNKTLIFCAFAAEEWGTSDSRYDWSAGAYAQLKTAHPDWVGRVELNINLELPAFSHGSKHFIRTVYEYKSFIKDCISSLPEEVNKLYPKGVGVISPVQTWSDDFCVALAGIPSLVNEFRISTFMETHYHSQYDSMECYNQNIYRFHHLLYTWLLLNMDCTILPPLNFAARFNKMDDALSDEWLNVNTEGVYRKVIAEAKKNGKILYDELMEIEERFEKKSPDKNLTENLRRKLLSIFKYCQDNFVSLDWYESAIFPFENAQKNVLSLKDAATALRAGDVKGAMDELIEIDDNNYAAVFDKEVTDYFCKQVLEGSEHQLKWGYNRLKRSGRMDLSDIMKRIKHRDSDDDFEDEIHEILDLRKKEHDRLEQLVQEITKQIKFVTAQLKDALKTAKKIK